MATRTRSQPTFDELVDELEARVDGIVDVHIRRMRDHYPEQAVGDPVVEQRIREFSVESMLAEYGCLRAGELPDEPPSRDAEGARELARLGIPIDWVLTGFRVGHRCHWEAWIDLVESRVDDSAARRGLLDRGSRFFFDYVDRLTALITEEYERERQRLRRRQGSERVLLVHQFLNGAELDSDALGWPLEHHHLGLLAWAEGADRALRELAASLGRPLLIVQSGVDQAWFGWASSGAPLSSADRRKVADFRPRRGRIAIGLEASGGEGFKLTNRQARRAGWVAWYTAALTTHFRDVALEALAIEDADSAHRFTEEELRGFDDDSTRSARLCQTLVAYFDSDHNAAAAAAKLGVHQQTVANRIRAVEELLGAPVASRRAELELALRLRRCFEKPPSLQAGLQNEGYLP
ncbi:MAG: helix-turn-helix domain-containing protein [Solirubrobacterales bacterium]